MSKRKTNKSRTNNHHVAGNNVIQFNDYLPSKTRKKHVEIIPRNLAQEDYIVAIEDCTIVFGIGPAGTGKTLIATLLAIRALKENEIEKIIITRPAVSVDEQHGFLPGSLVEKMAPWTRPIFDVFEEYFSPKEIESMIEENIIEVAPLAYMRGRTLNDACIILDEAQNTTCAQMKMFLTRMGEGSRIVVSGDVTQVDLPGGVTSGLRDAWQRLGGIKGISFVTLGSRDIVRHKLVQNIVERYDSREAANQNLAAQAGMVDKREREKDSPN